jgi:glycosyltransferase involved in cell wall biosynthesis
LFFIKADVKILQINGYESPGRRFNGLSLTPLLKARGIDSTHLVWEKDTRDPSVLSLSGKSERFNRIVGSVEHTLSLCQGFNREVRIGKRTVSLHKVFNLVARMSLQRGLNWIIGKVERVLSLQSVLYLNSLRLRRMPVYKEADLLHLHIIHSGYLSLWALPGITRQKPTVWTLHDPWAMTGHCIHPFGCTRWQTGCGECPNLKTPLPLYADRTNLLFKYKHHVYSKSKFNVIVASQWMLNMVQASPLFEGVRVHLVPFGLDLDFFSPASVPNARRRFGITDNTLVLCFRSEMDEFKGLPYIIQVLEQIRCDQPICLLTFAKKGLLDRFADRFQLVELGWSDDEELMRDALVAADIFLMPSTAEAFGVMAIEAMACGKPVISFDGTSLPEVTFAPDVGVSVPMKDTEALLHALQRLIDHPEERLERGREGRLMAEKHYDAEIQADRLAAIYRMVASR